MADTPLVQEEITLPDGTVIKVIGSDLAARYPERYGQARASDALRAREPCPVCGHPTGDCH